ncbi:MAG: class I SAM-dependent methyltransferase [Candidatus Altiarchaeales archaeon]|nr:class I SAM-dependent methyltransferase [Candidatus Altiarchaeales archaeon]
MKEMGEVARPWLKVWDSEDFNEHLASLKRMQERDAIIFLDFLPEEGKILDAGCGIGGACHLIQEKESREIYGIDLLENAIKKANENKREDMHFSVGDITALNFPDNYFNLVLSRGVVEHLPEPEKAVAELSRVLKKGGILFITVPNKHCYTHRLYRWFYRRIGLWKVGKELSMSARELEELCSKHNCETIESGTFDILRALLNLFTLPDKQNILSKMALPIRGLIYYTLRDLLKTRKTRFGFMTYVAARKK